MIDTGNEIFKMLGTKEKLLLLALDSNSKDNFVNNPRIIIKNLNCTNKDVLTLVKYNFIRVKENGVEMVADVPSISFDTEESIPSKEEIEIYCKSRDYKFDIDKFYNYYLKYGFKYPNETKVNWKSKADNWGITERTKSANWGSNGNQSFDSNEFARVAYERTYGKENNND